MESIMVSVMITYYNQKKYIEDSLESVLNQNVDFSFEILCGDDGSDDGTYEELLEWQKKFPEIITVYQMERSEGKHEPIVRVSNNRMHLFSHARGKYVVFLDGDDYFIDNLKLKRQVEVLEKNNNCSCCGHPIRVVWDDKSQKERYLGVINDEELYITSKKYWSSIWLHADTFLYRNYYKQMCDEINSDLFDDNLITAYFLKYGDVIYLPQIMCAYRQVGNSSWNMRDEWARAYVDLFAYQEAKRILPTFRWANFCRAQWLIQLLYSYRRHNDLENVVTDSQFVLTEKIYEDTRKFCKNSAIKKIVYYMKYYIPAHMQTLVNAVKWMNMLSYRRM